MEVTALPTEPQPLPPLLVMLYLTSFAIGVSNSTVYLSAPIILQLWVRVTGTRFIELLSNIKYTVLVIAL